MEKNQLTKDLFKWELNAENLTADQLEILNIINFPKKLGYRDTAQKRIKRTRANNGYIDNNNYNINEVRYNVINKNVAFFEIQRLTASGSTPQQLEKSAEFIQGVLRSKSFKHVYIDAQFIENELKNILARFGAPAATPSMIESKPKINAVEPKSPEKPKQTRAKKTTPKKKGLTPEIEAQALEMLQGGNYDIKETAEALGVTQTAIKSLLKTLKDA